MAYSATGTHPLGLHLVGTGAAGKIYSYHTADAKATVVAADYFLTDYQKFDPGDVVHVRAVVGGTEVHFDLSILVSNSTTVTCLSSASRA
jgi:hypothetical protein